MTWMALLLRYWWAIALAVALAWTHWLAYDYGRSEADAAAAAAKARQYQLDLNAIRTATALAKEAQGKLDKALANVPRTGQRVSDAVRNNPTPVTCVVPKEVTDALNEGISAYN